MSLASRRVDAVDALGRARTAVTTSARLLVGELVRSRNPVVRRVYTGGRTAVRRSVNLVTGQQLGWVAMLWSARWLDPDEHGGDVLELTGWAYERGCGFPDAPPRIELWLEWGRERIAAVVETAVEPEANVRATRGDFDYSNTAFVARLDLSALRSRTRAGDDTRWLARIRVCGDGRTVQGPFRNRYHLACAGHLYARTADGVQLLPRWLPGEGGLQLVAARVRAMATSVAVDGRQVRVEVDAGGARLVGAEMVCEELVVSMNCSPGAAGWLIAGELPMTRPAELLDPGIAARRSFRVITDTGAELPVATALDASVVADDPAASLLVTAGRDGELVLLDAPRQALVDDVTYEAEPEPALRVRGRLFGAGAAAPLVQFWSPRQVLPGELTVRPGDRSEDRTFEAYVPLLAPVWGERPLPPRVGGYRMELRAGPGSRDRIPVSCSPELTAALPRHELSRPDGLAAFMFRLQSGPQQRFQFRVQPARRSDETGPYHQQRLLDDYLATDWKPRDAVYFESFYGRNATCNPRALDRVIAELHPELERIWGVVDASVPVPEGSVAVIQGSKEWWQARATSRWVIANDWLRTRFVRQPYQVVLQTWHGSMFKRIGLDRPHVPRDKRKGLLVETANWDLLLSQNPHSTGIFASAYAWRGPVLEEGYPRNDPLSREDGSDIRRRLGISADKTTVLYAPTWRENLDGLVAFLDLERLCAELGDDYVLLLRGHSRTVEFGESVQVPGVIDVTTYPDITDLYLAADAMVTDYSSVMFDYSVTGRPMIFFTPDLAAYRDRLRGTYFDLEELAPGPVLATQGEVTDAIRNLTTQGERFADGYRHWNELFNPWDDGQSGERVVKQLMTTRPTSYLR